MQDNPPGVGEWRLIETHIPAHPQECFAHGWDLTCVEDSMRELKISRRIDQRTVGLRPAATRSRSLRMVPSDTVPVRPM